jgi:hypothetical protein
MHLRPRPWLGIARAHKKPRATWATQDCKDMQIWCHNLDGSIVMPSLAQPRVLVDQAVESYVRIDWKF